MPKVSFYLRNEDLDAWKAIEHKSDVIHAAIVRDNIEKHHAKPLVPTNLQEIPDSGIMKVSWPTSNASTPNELSAVPSVPHTVGSATPKAEPQHGISTDDMMRLEQRRRMGL